MLHLLLAVALIPILHVTTMAVVGRAMGARLHWVSFGWGPMLFKGQNLHVRALPGMGSVRFSHSVEDGLPESDWHLALDRLSLPAQWLVTLSGCALLLALAVALHGYAAVEAFLALPAQLLAGAVSPFGDAQTLLREAADAVRSSSFAVLLALIAAKVAAFNLLPLPMLNGGAAVAALGRRLGLARHWPPAATHALICVYLALAALWALALGGYLLGLGMASLH